MMDPRRANRVDHETLGLLMSADDDAYSDTLEVKVFDVSHLGVGFESPVPLPVHGQYRIRIGAGPLCLESRLRVVTCRQRGDSVFRVGAEFV